jgi:hypothetical protein
MYCATKQLFSFRHDRPAQPLLFRLAPVPVHSVACRVGRLIPKSVFHVGSKNKSAPPDTAHKIRADEPTRYLAYNAVAPRPPNSGLTDVVTLIESNYLAPQPPIRIPVRDKGVIGVARSPCVQPEHDRSSIAPYGSVRPIRIGPNQKAQGPAIVCHCDVADVQTIGVVVPVRLQLDVAGSGRGNQRCQTNHQRHEADTPSPHLVTVASRRSQV